MKNGLSGVFGIALKSRGVILADVATEITTSDPIKLQPWQKKAFKKLKDADHAILTAFCGSGKSILLMALSIYDVLRTGRKQIIVVSKRLIHDGFTRYQRYELDKEICGKKKICCGDGDEKNIYSCAPMNCCNEDFLESTVESVIKFILSPARRSPNELWNVGGENGMILITTHATMALVYKKLLQNGSGYNKKTIDKAFKKIRLVSDEAHHISHVGEESSDLKGTELGQAVEYMLDLKACVTLATATFFRGDHADIMSPHYMKMFKSYNYDFTDFWKTLNLDGLVFKHITCSGEDSDDAIMKKVIQNIRKDQNGRHIIKLRKESYVDDIGTGSLLSRYLIELKKIYTHTEILDLVSQTEQEKGCRILQEENLRASQGGPDILRVIIACDIFNEGTDWPAATTLHNTDPGSSVVKELQLMGRIFRYHPDKKIITACYYGPEFSDMNKAQAVVSDRLNALMVVMILADMFNPVKLRSIKDNKKRSLQDRLGQSQYKKLLASMICQIRDLLRKNHGILSSAESENIVRNAVDQFYPVNSGLNREDFLIAVRAHFIRLGSNNKAIDVSFIRKKEGFDKIVKSMEFCDVFQTENPLSDEDFKTVGEIARKHFKSWVPNRLPPALKLMKKSISFLNLIQEFIGENGSIGVWKPFLEDFQKSYGHLKVSNHVDISMHVQEWLNKFLTKDKQTGLVGITALETMRRWALNEVPFNFDQADRIALEELTGLECFFRVGQKSSIKSPLEEGDLCSGKIGWVMNTPKVTHLFDRQECCAWGCPDYTSNLGVKLIMTVEKTGIVLPFLIPVEWLEVTYEQGFSYLIDTCPKGINNK